jgi:penicillin G amidase
LLVAFLAAVYWYGWRSLPETSGETSAPISANGTITRDNLGVPHVQAASWEDAIFLQGYAMAQDRLWQMDALRRRAAGELAEVAGRVALPSDEESRRFRLRRLAEQHEKTLTPEERAVFSAFARGVNHYISTHRDRLPPEFAILRYEPRPWTVRDSILAGLEMYRFLGAGWRNEILKQRMIARGDRAKVDFLFPPQNSGEAQPGSNAWVISGARSVTGKPILANDPHLEYSLPSPWYLVHLEAPGLNVTGGSIVGLPAVIIGHNEHIAWGMTNLEFDVQDLYREQIDMRSGRYVSQGTIQQAVSEQEAIAIKGDAPNNILTWVTRHGPVFASETAPNGQVQTYAVHWTAAEPQGLTYPFLEINRASNWQDFKNAIGRYAGPGQNFVYADADGNIGYHAAGHIPIRKGCIGDVPSDGASGECEWDGYVSFENLPQEYNPPSGIIATANQNPFGANPRFPVNGNFAPRYRVDQIRTLLASRPKWKPEEMIRVQTDVYSAFHQFLATEVIAAFDRVKPNNAELRDAVAELRKWNGQMAKDQSAPMLVTLTFEQLRKLAADRAAAGQGDNYLLQASYTAMEQLLRTRPKDWFPDYDALLIRCLTGAIEIGRKAQGSNVTRWKYGQAQPLRLLNPVEGQLPWIGKYFNIGPVAMGGAPVTVQQYTGRLGPSLRMSIDLADLNHSTVNIATGESEHRFSSHYKDQWDAYYAGRSFPMQFTKVEAKEVLKVKPE